ncbi:hypothetical protein K504DRAFT_370326 [Pleomassaria siparia CBS 279.74]|uniref:Mid2 domain-containing protein n=1 Tax=Pleomassaria siparia CBS 279.74 TaxID=1314801 RepID=A0A6G1KLV6_9PLEO|nr:hypothetical protein K504DRAFT_370326 [Pleomassaria siparia CBS 279.74]
MLSRYAFGLASCLNIVAAGVTPLTPAIRVRNAPGASTADTYRAVGRALYEAREEKGKVAFDANVTLDHSWNGATLFTYAPDPDEVAPNANVAGTVTITCTTCYIKGIAKASLTVAEDFDIGMAMQKTIDSVQVQVDNLTDHVVDDIQEYFSGVIVKASDGFDADDFEFPTLNYTFDVDVPTIPQSDLRFTFDGMEMYVALQTSLNAGATYNLNLFSSNSPLGISIGKNLKAGLVFTIDLILMVEGEIDISSGFHIKLEDDISIHIPLFDDKVGSIGFNGGKFEFLPVTIEKAGTVLSAFLKIGAQVGFELSTPTTLPALPDISGGIEVGVFANVAEFVTNVTQAPKDDDCELQVVQGYAFAIGAAAGATVKVADIEYGPVAETSIPIFYTELSSACAIKGNPTPAPAVTPRAFELQRADLTTTTISTSNIYTGVTCMNTTLINCPVSQQKTTQYTVTKTTVVSVPSGETATFPASTSSGVASVIEFGESVQSLFSTSGSPTSYVPPPPPSDTATAGATNHESNNDDESLKDKLTKGTVGGVDKKVIIGASVGGGLLLIAIIAGLL